MTAVFLVLLFLLILANGFFVAAEFALVRSRRSRIEQLSSEGSRGASAAIAQLIEPIFGGFSHGVAVAISVAIAYTLTTTLHVVVGEQAPKYFAIARPERSARALAAPLRWFRRISAPFTVALTWMSNGVVRLFGVRPAELESQPTTDDLKVLISQSAVGGDLDPGEAG